jgi:hypothetical protein
MLKAEAWPLSRDAPTWRADAIDFRQQAADRFTPSMRQKIEVARLSAWCTDPLMGAGESIDIGRAPVSNSGCLPCPSS